jgi:signal transduction histidine kinase
MVSRQDLQANRFELISRLADDLAHEIKNPLHAMVINLEVLRRRLRAGDDDVALERAAVVEHEVLRVNTIVDHLLRLLRPDTGGVQPVGVAAILAEFVPLLELQARLARIEFHYQPAADEPIVAVDRADFKFAVLNLADALLASVRETGGRLAIAVDADPREVRVHFAAQAALAVETTGAAAGILSPTDRADSACAMAGELVRGSGGRVALQNRADSGAVAAFLLVLPRFNGA